MHVRYEAAAVMSIIAYALITAVQVDMRAQSNVDIDTLRRDFGATYKKEVVRIEGYVASERRVTSLTYKGFYLRDRFGALVLVRTTQPLPEINQRLAVTGVALMDPDNRDIFVSETAREYLTSGTTGASRPNPPHSPPAYGNTFWLVLAGVGLCATAAIVLYILRPGRSRSQAFKKLASVIPATPVTSAGSAAHADMQVDDFRTVKVYKTTKVLPGKLVVVEGGRETDILYLSDQSGRGEVEIGRDSPDIAEGIRVKDKTNTVSRHQARIAYLAGAHEFKLTNLAGDAANPTTVNGRTMGQSETVGLTDGDVLSMGNLQLMFKM